MQKIAESNKFISNIHSQLMRKIKTPKSCKNNEQIVKLWRFENKPVHAGQIQGTKILPNGNKQVRITTAYAGDGSQIALDTRVYSPSGELLKVYHGIRGTETKFITPENELIKHILPTRAYANDTKGVAKIIRQEQKLNPEVKYLPNFPKS